MRVVAIIQARMGSTRLPGKVLMDLYGGTILAWTVRRANRARTIDEVVVATTTLDRDDAIVRECAIVGVRCFRGSEDDILDRYYQTARTVGADVIVRITSDCPLIDPEIIDAVVTDFQRIRPDYASNTLQRRRPRGLDVEVVSMKALEEAWVEDDNARTRAHVTPFLYLTAGRFTVHSVFFEGDFSELRWTVDTAEDLKVIRGIVAALGGRDDFGWREALSIVQESPALVEANRHIRQKSLEDDP